MIGRFIVFEGVEGSGKTTQIRKTCDFLQPQGKKVIITKEPGGTELGVKLRHILLDKTWEDPPHDRTELLLYAADRSQHIEELIKPALAEGTIVLCDRFTDSTIAYQGYGRGLDLGLIHQLNEIATNGLQSDLTFWLKIDVELGLERVNKRGGTNRIDRESLEFHRRVQDGFEALAQTHPNRIIPIDATLPEKLVSHQIQDALIKKMELGLSF